MFRRWRPDPSHAFSPSAFFPYFLVLLYFPVFCKPVQASSSSATACNHRFQHTYILACIRETHDTFSPQEKPWARTGRKTLENQDTIWHLWSLNDFLLGVGLCPTGKSQKTGRENYIRENVYAAHSAPSLFTPQMSDYSSTLNLWESEGGGGVTERRRFFPSLAFGRGSRWYSILLCHNVSFLFGLAGQRNMQSPLCEIDWLHWEGGHMGRAFTQAGTHTQSPSFGVRPIPV